LDPLCSACFSALHAASTCVAPKPSRRPAPPAPSACSSSHRALARPAALARAPRQPRAGCTACRLLGATRRELPRQPSRRSASSHATPAHPPAALPALGSPEPPGLLLRPPPERLVEEREGEGKMRRR
jgi:hypothetical protein